MSQEQNMSLFAESIGSTAAFLTTASFVPQVLRTVRTRDTQAISLWMYVMFSTGVALWGVYGLLIRSWPVVVANAVTLVLALLVLWHKARSALRDRRLRNDPEI
jgi:MtN3 and saliva related transmembrane protein